MPRYASYTFWYVSDVILTFADPHEAGRLSGVSYSNLSLWGAMASSRTGTGPRDVFLHLLVIIFLYTSVISFGVLLFQYINIAFPDILNGDYGRTGRASVRWPLAVLTIVFPLYVWLNTLLQRELVREPSKRELRTRKWLIAFTIFLTALAIVSDLVSLIYHFLSGGLTVRFILKILAILVIACSVFFYYVWNFRMAIPPSENTSMRFFVRSTVAVGGVAILAGFFVAGSPFAERLRQFDERRIADLSSIQWQIIEYWQSKAMLPPSIGELRDDIRGFVPPRDPETNDPYEYRIKGKSVFELCAVFRTGSDGDGTVGRSQPAFRDPYGYSESWSHGEGRTCFERSIDPDRFPPHQKSDAPFTIVPPKE
jgi:hypothetical protein